MSPRKSEHKFDLFILKIFHGFTLVAGAIGVMYLLFHHIAYSPLFLLVICVPALIGMEKLDIEINTPKTKYRSSIRKTIDKEDIFNFLLFVGLWIVMIFLKKYGEERLFPESFFYIITTHQYILYVFVSKHLIHKMEQQQRQNLGGVFGFFLTISLLISLNF